jgi:PPP family 3-phenylpropionic acid transporter
MSRQPNATPQFTLIQGLYWMAYCILVSFSSVYLLERGFSNSQIGLLISVSSILSAVFQPVAAARADRMVRFSLRQVCAGMALVMALAAGGLLLLPGKIPQALLYMALLVLLQLLTPFLYSLAMDCHNNHINLNYGLARGAGGATYALASALCGTLTAAFGVMVLPLTLVILTAVLTPILLTFRYGGPVGKTLPRGEALETYRDDTPFLKKYPQVPLLLGAISLLFTSHNILMSFPFQIVQGIGGGTQEMGTLLTVQSIADIPAMVFFALLLKFAGSRFWVKVSSVSFFLHALLTWLAPGLPMLCGIQFLETTGYALYTVAAVYFVNEIIDLPDRVQGQAYFSMTNTIGIVLGSSVGGVLLDWWGSGALLAFATVTGGAGMIILLYALKRPIPLQTSV